MADIPKSPVITLKTTYKLHSGYEMPIVGFGVYQTPITATKSVVLEAFHCGYRHVDSARAYRNERPCADAIRASGLQRDQIFFTSKIPPKEMGYDRAMRSIEATLSETGLEYIDLYLIHSPYGGREARCGSWRALVDAQERGLVRSIGISNYGLHHLVELEDYITTSGVGSKIDVGQWELHPWLPHDDIVTWARQRGIVVQAWSPLVRAERANEIVLQSLSEKHGKSWAQILIRWSIQKGYVPLPKSVRTDKIRENADVFDFELSTAEMESLAFPNSYAPCSWDPTTSHD